MKATAIANANIALVKYWGKRNEKLFLPFNSSVSVTLDGLNTITTVKFDTGFSCDEFVLDGKKQSGADAQKVFDHLSLVRKWSDRKLFARVESTNNFPAGAGLASSASAFAALTVAAVNALGVNATQKELSILARQGSGSACRSIFGGFVEWKKGSQPDGLDSFGVQLFDENYWPEFRVLACIVSEEKKKIKSRAGMTQAVKTSPFYKEWIETVEKDLAMVKKGIKEKNLKLLGSAAEHNCLKMHATMITTKPSILYWKPKTIELMNTVCDMREDGMSVFFTIDAGPQVKILCLQKDVQRIRQKVQEKGVKKITETRPGSGAKLTQKHLF